MRYFLFALLLAVPLSAQQVTTDTLGITVTRIVNINGDTTFVSIDVVIRGAPCDSACIEREELGDRLTQGLIDGLQRTCGTCSGPSRVNIATNLGLVAVGLLIAWRIKDQEHVVTVIQPKSEPVVEPIEEPSGEGRGEGQ